MKKRGSFASLKGSGLRPWGVSGCALEGRSVDYRIKRLQDDGLYGEKV